MNQEAIIDIETEIFEILERRKVSVCLAKKILDDCKAHLDYHSKVIINMGLVMER